MSFFGNLLWSILVKDFDLFVVKGGLILLLFKDKAYFFILSLCWDH